MIGWGLLWYDTLNARLSFCFCNLLYCYILYFLATPTTLGISVSIGRQRKKVPVPISRWIGRWTVSTVRAAVSMIFGVWGSNLQSAERGCQMRYLVRPAVIIRGCSCGFAWLDRSFRPSYSSLAHACKTAWITINMHASNTESLRGAIQWIWYTQKFNIVPCFRIS